MNRRGFLATLAGGLAGLRFAGVEVPAVPVHKELGYVLTFPDSPTPWMCSGFVRSIAPGDMLRTSDYLPKWDDNLF